MKIVCVLPIRLGSKRLKRKHMCEVLGKPILDWMLDRLAYQIELHFGNHLDFLIATTDEPENSVLDIFKPKATVFRGSKENIPLRLLMACKAAKAEGLVSIDGDDVLCSGLGVSCVARSLEKGRQYVVTSGLPLGMNSSGFSRNFIESVLTGYEHQTLETGWGRIFDVNALETISLETDLATSVIKSLRFTLDYPEDLQFFRKLLELLGEEFVTASDEKIIKIVLNKNLNSLLDKIRDEYWVNFNDEKAREIQRQAHFDRKLD